MKKYILKLVKLFESDLFDDDYDDIIGDDMDKPDINPLLTGVFRKVEDILYKQVFESRYSWVRDDNTVEKKIYTDLTDTTVAFYYNRNDKKQYIRSVTLNSVKEAQDFIDIFDNTGVICLLQLSIEVSNYTGIKPDDVNKNVVDFKNIIFDGVNLKGIHPKNLICDCDKIIATGDYNKLVKDLDPYYLVNNRADAHFLNCWINDTIQINSVDEVGLQACYNIKDYSFIKKVYNKFYNNTYTGLHVPESRNLTGLPEGLYAITLEYRLNNQNGDYYTNITEPITFVGLPLGCKSIRFRSDIRPWLFLQHISFEGLKMQDLQKLDFEAERFPGRNSHVWIQLGPYKFETSCRRWCPTKPLFKTILTSQDWFLDCYKDTPHKEYIAPDNDITNAAMEKEQKKVDAANQKALDAKEDMDLMIKNVKKLLIPGTIYYGNHWLLKVELITENKILYVWFKRYNILRKITTIEAFIKWLDTVSSSFRMDKDDPDSKKLLDVIIAPVLRIRERVNKKRKEEAAEARKLQRAQAKAEKQLEKELEVVKENKPKQQEVKEEPKNNQNIKIIDYSDKAIVVYGDTWNIKDKLKELGCRYNKFLTIDGKKTPGWIVSKKKRSEIEEIINNL